MKVTLSGHAKQRIKERFKIGNQTPEQWVENMLSKAMYCGVGVDDDGNESRVYSFRGASFFLAIKADVVKSVIPPRKSDRKRYRDAVTRVIAEELARVNDTISQQIESIQTFVDELIEEIEYLNDCLKRTRSLPKKLAIKGRIKAVEERVNELPEEAHELKRELTRYARGAAAYL
ncbi:hypothetical protein [Cytobacillus solani]|uniref:Uncharacterized protein n=1 Tax=Cytobacillus solani TaxID=1637975 RepID=A0A0Q3SH62_9BACI|nr:hypothetical protein [Cytobacillus solani]KQL18820.1 hypothetical protein AN957_09710 [Cytobacillus solani]